MNIENHSVVSAASSVQGLIDRWEQCLASVESAKRRLADAENELAESRRNLGAIICPDDAKPLEVFHIWAKGSGMLAATYFDSTTYKIEWRKEPRRK